MMPEEAVMELTRIGFCFRLDGEVVKMRFEGGRLPDLVAVDALVGIVKRHKDEVRYFLKSYCPRCGGVGTCPDYEGRPLCLGCDRDELVRLYPGMAAVNHGR
jgi:hypothetical protein